MSTRRFSFRLQRLLALRQMAERAAAVSLGSSQAMASEAHVAEERLAARRSDARAGMFPPRGAARHVGEVLQAARFVEQIDVQLEHAGSAAQQADARVRDTRLHLGERVRERRILERLRDRHFAVWANDVEHEEREIMDGIARPPAGQPAETTPSTGD